jgi:hypothetical protein
MRDVKVLNSSTRFDNQIKIKKVLNSSIDYLQ